MELQIQITMSYHLTPARMAVIKKTEITSVGEAVAEREPLFTVGRNENW